MVASECCRMHTGWMDCTFQHCLCIRLSSSKRSFGLNRNQKSKTCHEPKVLQRNCINCELNIFFFLFAKKKLHSCFVVQSGILTVKRTNLECSFRTSAVFCSTAVCTNEIKGFFKMLCNTNQETHVFFFCNCIQIPDFFFP